MAIFFQVSTDLLGGGSTFGFGGQQKIAQKVIAQQDETLVTVGVWAYISNGSPVDDLVLNIYEGGATPESGTLIAGPISVPMATLPIANVNFLGNPSAIFLLDSPFPLISGETYFYVLGRSGALGLTNTPGYRYTGVPAVIPNADAWYLDGGGWHEYTNSNDGFILYNSLPGNLYLQTTLLVGAESGDVQTLNIGKDDDSTPIYYELETQEIDFFQRGHLKKISDKIGILGNFGGNSSFQISQDGEYKAVPIDLTGRVNIGEEINVEGHYFTLKWFGEVDESSPILEGIYLENVMDLGITRS